LPRTQEDIGATFDSIAEAFDVTRSRPWSFVTEWLEGLGPLVRPILDVGCGNGRHLVVAGQTGMRGVGIDLSARLLEIARQRLGPGTDLLIGDARDLPIATDAAGALLAVAVIHHIQEAQGRRTAISEIRRVLAPGGEAMVSVWALDDPDVATRVRARPMEGGDGADLWVPWRAPGGPIIDRYLRVISSEELADILVEGGLEMVRSWDAGANHVALVMAL
jgi:tRNA (uracil-5-)-methyltransferase TRM9